MLAPSEAKATTMPEQTIIFAKISNWTILFFLVLCYLLCFKYIIYIVICQ